jgi:hypothetical protein
MADFHAWVPVAEGFVLAFSQGCVQTQGAPVLALVLAL